MKRFLIITVFLFPAYCSFGQEIQLYLQEPVRLNLLKKPFQLSLREPHMQLDLLQNVPMDLSIDGEPQKGAFFCRMERSSWKKFGVMIQVHAGDYSKYTQPSNRALSSPGR